MKTYCIGCHGEEKQKGERRFDQLQFPLKNNDALILAQDMIDALVLGEMPPKKAENHPSEAERLALINYVRGETKLFYESNRSSGGETVLRRLNSREYKNTLRDLLHLNMQMFDPTKRFPLELTAEHFDNVGNTLVTSGYLLEQYLIAADQVVERTFSPEKQPEMQTWRFTAPFVQQPELTISQKQAYDSKFLCIHENHQLGQSLGRVCANFGFPGRGSL